MGSELRKEPRTDVVGLLLSVTLQSGPARAAEGVGPRGPEETHVGLAAVSLRGQRGARAPPAAPKQVIAEDEPLAFAQNGHGAALSAAAVTVRAARALLADLRRSTELGVSLDWMRMERERGGGGGGGGDIYIYMFLCVCACVCGHMFACMYGERQTETQGEKERERIMKGTLASIEDLVKSDQMFVWVPLDVWRSRMSRTQKGPGSVIAMSVISCRPLTVRQSGLPAHTIWTIAGPQK